MTVEDTKRVVENFIKYLQLPESPYKLTESDSSDEVEMQIAKGDELQAAVTITNGSVSILYNGDFDEQKFFKQDFQSPIYLLYILSVVYYSTACKDINISFDDLMTILIGEEITNWKDLVVNLAHMVGVDAETDMDDVLLDGKKISYKDFSGKIKYGTLEFQVEPHSYTELIEAIFLIVEYAATLNDTQDTLFTEQPEEQVIEEPEEEPSMGGGSFGGMGDFGDDMGGLDMGAPGPVSPDESEDNPMDMDFSMPDGLDDAGMDDLLEPDGDIE